ncbi:MAG: hydrogenase-4 component G [Thermodesulfobacteriota bacterium]|nr:hydrogenase-4 component G [Thermodesulfobacteriota bacterium]
METGSVQKYTMNYRTQIMTGSVKAGTNTAKTLKGTDFNSVLLDFKIESYSFSLEHAREQTSVFSESDFTGFTPSVDTSQNLLGEDGYWGVKKTSGRIADFVLMGAGDDLEKLRAGKEGVLAGFKEAEKIWGGTLPAISYDTIDNALEAIDKKIRELGGSVVDIST